MTPLDQIGQMLCFGWSDVLHSDSRTVNAHAESLLRDLRVGSVVLMGRNISPPPALRAMLADLQTRAQAHGLPPLLVAVDQEGGRVSRLQRPHYTPHPPPRTLGAARQPEHARAWAGAIGHELASVGIGWDFAPVLDVDNNPANPVIGDRAFSDNPHVVARLGAAAVQGLQEDAGVLACGKHFPGHGDTDTDSHFALPRIPHPRARLESVELVPFRAAIDVGVGAIMTAHILFPALDAALPATLSPAVLSGLLRGELGYDGLIVTDDLEMRGVADGWGAPQAAVLAVRAGADVLLCCHTLATQRAIQAALLDAVRAGQITQTRLDESLARIARAKARWGAAPHAG